MALTRRALLAGTAASLAASAVRAAGREILHIEGPAFGARWSVRIDAESDGAAIAAAVASIVASVDAEMSPYRPTSAIGLFNATDTTDWLPLPPATLATLRQARRVARLTQGAFDPTVGGITGRYGFGPIRQAPAGSFDGVAIASGAARKDHALQTLDLCGIAKGHALDRVVAALSDAGHRDFLVEMGGEVMARGAHPDGRPWRVGVENPTPQSISIWHRVNVTGEALATSGDRTNSYLSGKHRYGHIIDPRRLMPADTALASVSVFAPQAVLADALATALFALGPENGPALAEQTGIAALFLIRDGNGHRDIITAGFSHRIAG